METYLDCIPCFFRQALEISRLAGVDEETRQAVIREVAAMVPEMTRQTCPPDIGRRVNEIVFRYTGGGDVFREIKEESNRKALKVCADLSGKVLASPDPLRTAVELAIAGNIIDYGAKHAIDLEAELLKILENDFGKNNGALFDYADFKDDLLRAEWILYLADNAGETAFDRLLIERLARDREVVYAVRGKPVINDALREDAVACGIDALARVVSSGSDAPGTVLERCSGEFLKLYSEAPLIVSKGQGNYEALAEEDRPIYFLLKIKCPLIGRNIGGNVGDMVLKKQGGAGGF